MSRQWISGTARPAPSKRSGRKRPERFRTSAPTPKTPGTARSRARRVTDRSGRASSTSVVERARLEHAVQHIVDERASHQPPHPSLRPPPPSFVSRRPFLCNVVFHYIFFFPSSIVSYSFLRSVMYSKQTHHRFCVTLLSAPALVRRPTRLRHAPDSRGLAHRLFQATSCSPRLAQPSHSQSRSRGAGRVRLRLRLKAARWLASRLVPRFLLVSAATEGELRVRPADSSRRPLRQRCSLPSAFRIESAFCRPGTAQRGSSTGVCALFRSRRYCSLCPIATASAT